MSDRNNSKEHLDNLESINWNDNSDIMELNDSELEKVNGGGGKPGGHTCPNCGSASISPKGWWIFSRTECHVCGKTW